MTNLFLKYCIIVPLAFSFSIIANANQSDVKVEFTVLEEGLTHAYSKYFKGPSIIIMITNNENVELNIICKGGPFQRFSEIRKIPGNKYLIGINADRASTYGGCIEIEGPNFPTTVVNLNEYGRMTHHNIYQFHLTNNSIVDYISNQEPINRGNFSNENGERIIDFKELISDISARTHPIVDSESIPCGIVKVRIPLVAVEFPDAVHVEDRENGEYWVYYKNGTSQFKITFPSTQSHITVYSKDYSISGIESKKTYAMTIQPSYTTYITELSEQFEDEETKETEKPMFGSEYVSTIKKFGLYLGNIFWGFDCLPYRLQIDDNRFKAIKKASDNGWPDATLMLIAIIEGKQYNQYVEYLKLDNIHDGLVRPYSDDGELIRDYIDKGKPELTRLQKLYKEQVNKLQELLDKDLNPTTICNFINTPIECSPMAFSELYSLSKEYTELAAFLHGSIPNLSGNWGWNKAYPKYGVTITNDNPYNKTFVIGGYMPDKPEYLRKYISPLCITFIERIRLHQWNRILELTKAIK